MDSIRIEGLRSLQDTGTIDLKPLTILIGENSAGKSTFLRTFPLLKQSFASNTRGAILWYGSYVDFGDFDHALSRFSIDKFIKIELGIDLSVYGKKNRSYVSDFLTKPFLSSYKIKFSIGRDKKKSERIHEVIIQSNDIKCDLTFERNKVESIFVNKIDLSEYFSEFDIREFGNGSGGNFLPIPRFSGGFDRSRGRHTDVPYVFSNPDIFDRLCKIISVFLRKGTNESQVVVQILKCNINDRKKFVQGVSNASNTKTWKSKIHILVNDDKIINELIALVFAYSIPALLLSFNTHISSLVSETNYIAPLRANAERYYRTQNLNVEQVDHQGSNLPMFIDNLTESQKDKFKNWMIENFGFSLDARATTGHLSLYLHYDGSDVDYNVTDMGFGFSQILPIITQLWYTVEQKKSHYDPFSPPIKSKVLVVEQPELHLHPRIQAKLLDVFIKAIYISRNEGINLKVIIETHSETIINYVGRSISRETLKKNDTAIVVFDKTKPDEPSRVKVSNYDDDGCLIDWPWGFFDAE